MAGRLVANMSNEGARIRHRQGESIDAGRDPLLALPVIDGPFKGMTFAHPADYFYLAQLDAPKPDATGVVQHWSNTVPIAKSARWKAVWSSASD